MDAGTPPPVTEGSGSEYAERFLHDAAYPFSPRAHGQGVSTPTHFPGSPGAFFAENPYRLPSVRNGFSFANVPVQHVGMNSQSSSHSATNPPDSASEAPAPAYQNGEQANLNQDAYNRYLWMHPQLSPSRASFAFSQSIPPVAVPPSPYYVNGRPHQQVYAQQPGPVLQQVGSQAASQPPFQVSPAQVSPVQVISPAQVSPPLPAEPQQASNAGAPSIHSQVPRPAPYMQFPQSAASAGSSQYRRHYRPHPTPNITGNAGSGPAPVHIRAGPSQTSRRRSRQLEEASPGLTGRPSSSHLRAQAAATSSADRPPGTVDFYAMLSLQEHMDMARRLPLGEWFRTMNTDQISALQNYADTLRGTRRRREDFDTYEGTPPPKGLDDQNDGRPEPKEAEELIANLECKICMSQMVDTVMLPCGHAILCRWCADQHMPSSRMDRSRPKGHATCPMCRAPVKQKFRIYLP